MIGRVRYAGCEIIVLTPGGPRRASSDRGMFDTLPARVREEVATVSSQVQRMAANISCGGGPARWPPEAEAWDAQTYAVRSPQPYATSALHV